VFVNVTRPGESSDAAPYSSGVTADQSPLVAAIDVGRRARSALPQQWRLAAAIIYFVAVLGLAQYLNGQFWPPYGLEGLWFYSAAAALLVGEFVVEPFFTRPADAIANGLAVLIAAVTVSLNGADISHHAASVGRVVVIVVAVDQKSTILPLPYAADADHAWRE
jgi:hypothetical protein